MIRPLSKEQRKHILGARDFRAGRNEAILSRRYDFCVVGSGPGGAVAASTLARSGHSVLLIERGPFLAPETFNFKVLEMSNRAGHLELTSGLRTLLYQGNALGGGSLVFGAVAMKPPSWVFDEWKALSGVDSIDAQALEPHYRQVAEVLSVTRQNPEAAENPPNAKVREMALALGRPEGLEVVRRYTGGCAGVGLCNLGCGFNLKGNMINSFIPLGLESGNLTVLTEAEALNLGGRGGPSGYRAQGVGVDIRDWSSGQRVRMAYLRCRTVIIAAGAYFSSALMLKTGNFPSRRQIGAKVFLQPHAQVFALFDQPMTRRGVLDAEKGYIPSNGVPAIYEFLGFLKDYRFFWLASILFPANLASFISALPPRQHFALMRRFHHLMSITLTLRDDPKKSRIQLEGRRPQLDFQESSQDIANLRHCFLMAARGFLAVGARRVFLPLMRPPRIESEADLDKIRRLKFSYKDLLLYSDHTSGGNGYGIDSRCGATDPWGKVWGTQNVYVCDSSLFPNAPGVNPSWTIMALSHRIASRLAES